MKTVKTLADLHRAALNSGAKLSVGGTRFNMSGERVHVPPKSEHVEPAAAPVPAPAEAPAAPPAPVIDMAPVAQAMLLSNEMIVQALAHLASLMPAPQAPSAAAPALQRPVAFDIERDEVTGSPTRIVPIYKD
jgi:hypothetical protein